MATQTGSARAARAWDLAERQHGAISRAQLLDLGFSVSAIRHRVARGRLRRAHRGVYLVHSIAVHDLTWWSAALLASGDAAALGHFSAGRILGCTEPGWPNGSGLDPVEVVVPSGRHPDHLGIRAHQSSHLALNAAAGSGGVIRRRGLRVTGPVETLLDLAGRLSRARLERAVNNADRNRLITPERLRREVACRSGSPGAPALRSLLDVATFALTESELERRFLSIALSAGLPKPLTGRTVNGYLVDFHWPELGLVVETDGLTYHRTAISQTKDLKRDHAHALAGLTCLRFSHAQVFHEPAEVRRTLSAVGKRIASGRDGFD